MKGELSVTEMRRFSFIVSGGLALIGLVSWYRGHSSIPMALWIIAAVLLLCGLILPRLLRPVYKAWMVLATVLVWVNTRIILMMLFYAVFAPVGLIMRLFRDPLDRKLHDGCSSYWKQKESRSFDPKTYEHQF